MIHLQKYIDVSFNHGTLETTCIRNKTISYLKADNCIGCHIKHGKYWELWMLSYISNNYVKHTNMIDLGANIGTTTLLMSEVISDNCKIYSFEPVFNNIICKNIIDNNLTDKIDLYPYGVSNIRDNITIKSIKFDNPQNFGGFSLLYNQVNRNDIEDILSIELFPLDYFNFENVSVIKIDVEHMEIQVLEGSYELIKRCKPTILIETYKYDEFINSEIFRKMIELGYTINPIVEGYNDFIMTIPNNQ